MTLPDPSPLTPEEQALAQRLSRLGPHAEPSPALDARVLAAAHAAAQAPVARALPRRRRWPALLGLAASLVLAVGLAWRLRPLPEPAAVPRPEHAALRDVVSPPPPAAPAPMPVEAPESNRVAPTAAPSLAAAPKPSAPAPAPAEPTAQTVTPSPPAPAAKAVMATPSPMSLPPPPAPPAPVLETAPSARAAATPAPAAPTVAPLAQDSGVDANEADQADASSGLREGDEPSEEVPPATVDSPAVRDAWLQRIHRLVDAGDITGARASLHEFERRYPDYPLPEDLRTLER